jgi:hypothetical protein
MFMFCIQSFFYYVLSPSAFLGSASWSCSCNILTVILYPKRENIEELLVLQIIKEHALKCKDEKLCAHKRK